MGDVHYECHYVGPVRGTAYTQTSESHTQWKCQKRKALLCMHAGFTPLTYYERGKGIEAANEYASGPAVGSAYSQT